MKLECERIRRLIGDRESIIEDIIHAIKERNYLKYEQLIYETASIIRNNTDFSEHYSIQLAREVGECALRLYLKVGT